MSSMLVVVKCVEEGIPSTQFSLSSSLFIFLSFDRCAESSFVEEHPRTLALVISFSCLSIEAYYTSVTFLAIADSIHSHTTA